jgi:uncharacterized protein (DUF1778 family)
MEQGWFTPLADELAQCLLDARACAAACEALLENARRGLDGERLQRLTSVLVAPAAITQVMIELLDRPRQLVLAAAQVCRETTLQGAEALAALDLPLDTAPAIAALRAASESSAALLDAAGRVY